jgi:hypothetical protein
MTLQPLPRLNFLIYEDNLIFFFISVLTDLIPPWPSHTTEYTECQVYSTILSSKLGPPTPSPTRECCLPPSGSRQDTLARGEGVGGPNFVDGTESQTLWYSRYTIIPLRYTTVHYQHYIFSGDQDSDKQICICTDFTQKSYVCLLPHQGNPVIKRACHEIEHSSEMCGKVQYRKKVLGGFLNFRFFFQSTKK